MKACNSSRDILLETLSLVWQLLRPYVQPARISQVMLADCRMLLRITIENRFVHFHSLWRDIKKPSYRTVVSRQKPKTLQIHDQFNVCAGGLCGRSSHVLLAICFHASVNVYLSLYFWTRISWTNLSITNSNTQCGFIGSTACHQRESEFRISANKRCS